MMSAGRSDTKAAAAGANKQTPSKGLDNAAKAQQRRAELERQEEERRKQVRHQIAVGAMMCCA